MLPHVLAVGEGLPMWLSGKESACQCRRCGFNPWVWKIPWSRKWQPTPVFLPGKFHGQRSLVDCSPPGVPWLSASTHAHMCALTRCMPPSPLFAVFLCPAYCWPPNLWYRLTFLTKPPFVSWSEAPDLPPSPSVLSFTILGFLKTDYHCWKWLNLDDPWQALFRGIVTRAFESVYT